MNQAKSRILKRIFTVLQPFPAGDSRNRSLYRAFKHTYSRLPWNQRDGYINQLQSQAAQLLADLRAAQQAEVAS